MTDPLIKGLSSVQLLALGCPDLMISIGTDMTLHRLGYQSGLAWTETGSRLSQATLDKIKTDELPRIFNAEGRCDLSAYIDAIKGKTTPYAALIEPVREFIASINARNIVDADKVEWERVA